jgi:hypothetical protein
LKNLKDETAGQLKININYLWQIIRKVTAELRNKFICPTRKSWDKGQEYKYPTIHCSFKVDDTQEIQERERDLLRCHPCDHFPLISGTHLTVTHKQLQQSEPSLSTKSYQAGIRIKH